MPDTHSPESAAREATPDAARLAPELTRDEKALIWTLATLEGLVAKGALEGGRWRLSEGGRESYRLIQAEGFQPTRDEMRRAMAILQAEVSDE